MAERAELTNLIAEQEKSAKIREQKQAKFDRIGSGEIKPGFHEGEPTLKGKDELEGDLQIVRARARLRSRINSLDARIAALDQQIDPELTTLATDYQNQLTTLRTRVEEMKRLASQDGGDQLAESIIQKWMAELDKQEQRAQQDPYLKRGLERLATQGSTLRAQEPEQPQPAVPIDERLKKYQEARKMFEIIIDGKNLKIMGKLSASSLETATNTTEESKMPFKDFCRAVYGKDDAKTMKDAREMIRMANKRSFLNLGLKVVIEGIGDQATVYLKRLTSTPPAPGDLPDNRDQEQLDIEEEIRKVEEMVKSSEREPGELFNTTELAQLCSLIGYRNHAHINFNGSSFIFETSEKVNEVIRNIMYHPAALVNNTHLPQDEFIKQYRLILVEKLRKILEDENFQQLIDSQANPDTKALLEWLHSQNQEAFFGLLPDFLLSQIIQSSREERGRPVSVWQEWTPSSELILKAKIKRAKGSVEAQENPPTPSETTPEIRLRPIPRSVEVIEEEPLLVTIEEAILMANLLSVQSELPNLLHYFKDSEYKTRDASTYQTLRERSLQKLEMFLSAGRIAREKIIKQQIETSVKQFLETLTLDKDNESIQKLVGQVKGFGYRQPNLADSWSKDKEAFEYWVDIDLLQLEILEESLEELTQIQDATVPSLPVALEIAGGQSVEISKKPKETESERRQILRPHLDRVKEIGLPDPASSSTITRGLKNSITKTKIEEWEGKHYISAVGIGGQDQPVYDHPTQALMFHLFYMEHTGGINPTRVRRDRRMLYRLHEELSQQPANPSNTAK